MAEGQILQDAIGVRLVNNGHLAEAPAPLGIFGGEQMAFAGVRTQHFAARGDFEALGHGLLCLNTFGTAHKYRLSSKKSV